MERIGQIVIIAALVGVVLGSCWGCAGVRLRLAVTTRDVQAARAVEVLVPGYGGSGVILDDRRVLTAAHVIEGGGAIKAVLRGGQSVDMRLEALDLQGDIARLVRTDRRGFGWARIRVARAMVDDRVCIVAARPVRAVSCGRVVTARRGPDGIWHEAETVGGNSGSALYDSRGRLVGIVTRRTNDPIGKPGGAATMVWGRRVLQ